MLCVKRVNSWANQTSWITKQSQYNYQSSLESQPAWGQLIKSPVDHKQKGWAGKNQDTYHIYTCVCVCVTWGPAQPKKKNK